MKHHCPALIVAAPASGQGKTLITAALARYCRDRGQRVRVFKIGPDFIDPMLLEWACGSPVYQLDLFMLGETQCRQLLFDAAADVDLILIEAVMGLFDGQPSSADLALMFDIPVLCVINAAAMAQTFGALAFGLANYRPGLRVAGVLANRVGGERHAEMLRESLPATIPWIGALSFDGRYGLPERHLGLVLPDEITDLDGCINHVAATIGPWMHHVSCQVEFSDPACHAALPTLLDGVRIAVAQDAAFAFIYRANLDLLVSLGASLVFFSPLNDSELPDCDALWLPGGYPELYMLRLTRNNAIMQAIRQHHQADKPILAECGGMLYLANSLQDVQGLAVDMVGILAGHAVVQSHLVALGLQQVDLPEGTLRGHSFHYSSFATSVVPVTTSENPNGGRGEAVYKLGSLTASYVHFYFPSCATVVASFFQPQQDARLNRSQTVACPG